ncbi:MAG: aconitate hydratase AcnA [Candidatus Nealsonbacteria bacterium]|nr:aconitate hydratase AcnA [Candidatus Nealsonbacteria bacterium]
MNDPFDARDTFDTGTATAGIYRLSRLEDAALTTVAALPYSIRVLLEAVLRGCDGFEVTEEDVKNLAAWDAASPAATEVPFKPARVILQDFTGVPAVVDLAAMRSAMKRIGGDPRRINPLIPVDLVVDHSVQVDRFGTADAMQTNVQLEFKRNNERYEFLRWGQQALDNFRVVPPGLGIIHQVNLEFLAECVSLRRDAAGPVAVPDTLVGTDSHTTMINGLGVLGWGVGGIEAEAVMLGRPLYMLSPEVIGMELVGRLPAGATATDMVLMVTQLLRAEGVVGKFVEYFGPALAEMKLADRAVLANMAPEYGATMGFFPIDEQTLAYLRQTGRSDEQVQLVERYCKEQQLFRTDDAATPKYTKMLSLDLSTVEPSLAGPKRPQDRVPLAQMKRAFGQALRAPTDQRGFALSNEQIEQTAEVVQEDRSTEIGHGAVVIAAITSCTNTSNPDVMLAAGLLAQKAVERGLSVAPYVKTSLAPGSRVVTDYFEKLKLNEPLEALGFHTVGYGCTTCIGNSGPLPEPVAKAVGDADLVAAAVLSGNRNFEGRISSMVKANYLASPPLVVAYAIAGRVDVDLTTEPLGTGSDGRDVYLADIWPSRDEIEAAVEAAVEPAMFRARYADVFQASPTWNAMQVSADEIFSWDAESTYVQEPPFLIDLAAEPSPIEPIRGARALLALGDSVTTDHISPAGAIDPSSPAGRYLQERGVAPSDFNSYGSRRGNDRVMTRGTFANIRLRNLLAPGTEGGVTRHLPDGEQMSVYEAAGEYREEGVPLIVLAGKEYGTGSSRDWAAKGTYLLGVRAVIAASYERIHRSNLVGMGVLPLEFPAGQSWESLGLSGEETFDVPELNDSIRPRSELTVRATGADGSVKEFSARVRIDTPVELEYYRNGGILQTVLRRLNRNE